MRLAAVAAIGLWLAGGCRERAPAEQRKIEGESASIGRALEVGVSGCHGLVEDPHRGNVCLVRKRKPLYLWIDDFSGSQIELRFANASIEATRVIHAEGTLLKIDPTATSGRLELESRAGVWTLELEPVSEDYNAAREAMITSWRAGDTNDALVQLDRTAGKLKKAEAELLGFLGARIALAAGDYERAFTTARQLAGSSTVSCFGSVMLLVAYIQLYLRPDFNAAEQSLRAAESAQRLDFDTRIGATYLRGVLDHWLGRMDESLLAFERAARWARSVGDDDQLASALVMQAVALARLGRFNEAEALAREVEQRATNLDDENLALDIRSSIAWITVLQREENSSLPAPSGDLRQMIEAYKARNDQRNLANRRLDLALVSIQDADIEAAVAELDAIDPAALDPDLLVWFEIASAKINLAQKQMQECEGHLDRARVFAELNQDRELQWYVAVTSGELELVRGRGDAALGRFEEASRLADELALSIAGNAGRSHFVATHSRADAAIVELLIKRGDLERAMCTAIGARVRHLRGLWARLRPPLSAEAELQYRQLLSRHRERKQAIAARLEKSWELSTLDLDALNDELGAEGDRADQLLADATSLLEEGAPAWSCVQTLPKVAGEALLTMLPSNDGRWLALLAQREPDGRLRMETAAVILEDPSQLNSAADAMLDQFESSLLRSSSLRVIPVGAFVAADFSSLWMARDQTELSVVYSLGLGTPPSARLEPRAVVIAGSKNLATVTEEVSSVGKSLRGLGWNVESQWDMMAAGQPSLLHYAGHGFNGGELGWQSAIELPDLGRVTAAQIVSGQRSPEIVVLGACGAGRVTGEAIDGGMNLAVAFLLAGAWLVIAPDHDVEDVVALEFGLRLYQELMTVSTAALVQELGRMQRGQFAREPEERSKSYASWRAWVP